MEERSIKFSVCIPNFNYANYIGETIRSVLDQTYSNYEIIIADNCSTDNSEDVIRSFKDERIRFIKNEMNLGFGPNLDIATEQTTGDYILLLSSDDIMKKDALMVYAEVIRTLPELDPNMVIFSAFDIIDQDGKRVRSKEVMPDHIRKAVSEKRIPSEKIKDIEIVKGHDAMKVIFSTTLSSAGQFCTTCYSRQLYKQVGGYRSATSIIPDATFIHKLGMRNANFVYTPENLFAYRIHMASNFSATQGMKNIKLLTDKYQITQSYQDTELKPLGLTAEMIRKTFIRHYCIEVPFYSMFRRNLSKAYYHLMFGLASYPGYMVVNWKFYVILLGMPFLLVYHILTMPFRKK
jgi:glycosyltransferase involved in cell wall biosynthesis